jgi:Tol biopolymer transport system component
MLVVTGALVVAALLASAVLVGDARSLPALIAFTRADGIYVMRADGSGVRPLRRGGVAGQVVDLAWSPDGRKLAFARGDGIWVMNADGSHVRRLLRVWPVGMVPSLSWSPDGRRLAYSSFQTRGRIWVMNADGSRKRLLSIPKLHLYAGVGIDWSQAGGRIAFTSGGWLSDLYLINTDGSGLHKLPNASRFVYQPRWSPDGRRIAFTSAPGASREEIAVLAADGDTPTQFLTNNDLLDSEPAWSPDGTRIAFVRGKEEACSLGCSPSKRSSHEIYLMNADGSGVTRLTHNQVGEGSPAWQPIASA